MAAEKATELPRLGKPNIKLSVHANHTVYEDQSPRTFIRLRLICIKQRLTGTYRRSPSLVDLVEECVARNTTVTSKCVHHTRIGCDGEGSVDNGVSKKITLKAI